MSKDTNGDEDYDNEEGEDDEDDEDHEDDEDDEVIACDVLPMAMFYDSTPNTIKVVFIPRIAKGHLPTRHQTP